MKILLVEDEGRSARQTRDSIERSAPGADVTVADCRDSALELIANDDFDLIVCDVKIPPTANSADVNEKHGLSVQAEARACCPGTPTIFLTGFAPEIDVRRQLSRGGVGVIFGLDAYPLTQLIEKDEVEELERAIAELHVAEQSLTNGCFIPPEPAVDEMLARAVRMYARTTAHSSAQLTSTTGLSGARTCIVELESEAGSPASVFIKVLPRDEALAEFDKYSRFVPNRLAPGTFAPVLPPVETGLRKDAALVSTLAAPGSESLFRRMGNDPSSAARAVDGLAEALAPWRLSSTVLQVPLSDLRREFVSDDRLHELGVDPADLAALEAATVAMTSAIAHGDLHGENVLVGAENRPLLIDFGDAGVAHAVTDPVVLEASLLFHRNGPLRENDRLRRGGINCWLDLEWLCQDNPLEEVIRATRRWSDSVDTRQATAAMLYAHTIRQIKYGEIEKEQLLGLAVACADVAREQ